MANRHTILVVDDEPDVVKSVQDLLRLEYKVLRRHPSPAGDGNHGHGRSACGHDRPAHAGDHRRRVSSPDPGGLSGSDPPLVYRLRRHPP